MILDLQRFVAEERPYWNELERLLARMDSRLRTRLTLEEAQRFHYLFERTASDLGRFTTFSTDPELRAYLEALVARAYGEMHASQAAVRPRGLAHWLRRTFPRTFRRHAWAFALSVALTLAGALFGGLSLALDPAAKSVLMPFPHLLQDPRVRVAAEEAGRNHADAGAQATFSTTLMTHNTRVATLSVSLGMTWGIGTSVLLLYNGIVLGAVTTDYLLAGQARFLAGWLLPHGSVEIPAFLIAGQAGLMLGAALLGRQSRRPLAERLRAIVPDVVTLVAGVALLLVWAGFIEAFLSQHHQPAIPYAAKTAFGLVQGALLTAYLLRSGRTRDSGTRDSPTSP
ncbi:MAG: stage II sporulation protein M [Verrucomicrobiales bacterium]|nr:stage II sporulation protein M [Verrucomicrobiales bacterium]